MQSISVVIPVYNGEENLQELLDRLLKVLEELDREFEIIFVDDNSADASWSLLCGLAESDSRVHGVRLSRNYGQHNALLCGIRMVRNEIIITMDDDLQHPPEELPKLLKELEGGYDVVYAPPQSEQHGLLRDLASQLTKLALQRVMGVKSARNVSAFRAFYTRLRDSFADCRSPYVSIDVLLTWGTTNFGVIPVEHAPRKAGVSNYSVSSLITHAINLMTGFTTLPLRIASILGFVFTFFGIGVFGWVLGSYLIYGATVPGFAFLASIIVIFSGVQLFSLGIIGEYIARMHFRSIERPTFHVREITGSFADK